jgi:hypothetical protein
MIIAAIIAPTVKYLTVVIPAKAGIQKGTGSRIKSGMTGLGYLVAELICFNLKRSRWSLNCKTFIFCGKKIKAITKTRNLKTTKRFMAFFVVS